MERAIDDKNGEFRVAKADGEGILVVITDVQDGLRGAVMRDDDAHAVRSGADEMEGAG